jgi:hypothetical protein
MTTKVKVGDIINVKGDPDWNGSLVTEINWGGPYPVYFTHPLQGEGAETFDGVTVVSRAADNTKEGWTLASPDYTPQDNHEVSYCMGVATHWREVSVRLKVTYHPNGIFNATDCRVNPEKNNATATLNGKTWTIELY